MVYFQHMNVHFSTEARKREQTPVDNLFFSEYMPDADGEAVKVYLYGLMQCRYPSMGEVAIAEALGMPEGAVRAAFVYWQSKGLVRILKDEPLEVEYLTMEQPAGTTAIPMKYHTLVRTLNQLTAPRQFTMNELGHIYDCIEIFRLEEKAVLELVSYCLELKGANVRIQYIMTVAKGWADKGITTYEQARKQIEKERILWHGASLIADRLRLGRLPSDDEIRLYETWVYVWGFDEEAIHTVCSRMTDLRSPTFKKLNDRLQELYEQNKVKAEDVEAYSAEQDSERAFASQVFKRMKKVSAPTKDEIWQLSTFTNGPEGLPREVVLLAADACADAQWPFGKLKTILKDWAEKKVRTVEEARQALSERQTRYAQADSRRKTRSRNTLLNYAEKGVSHANLDEIAMDIDEL